MPGDLLTDLETAGVIGDPIYELNWLTNSSLWSTNTWNYTTTFSVSDRSLQGMRAGTSTTLLVFDGIKMGAHVYVNGQWLGDAVDQFLRYQFDLSAAAAVLRADGANTVVVSFDPSLTVDGRFMACTGGWDWAPYSDQTQSANPGNAHVLSKGIWKSVYTVDVSTAAITHVVPHTFYLGDYPVQPLQDGKHAGFRLDVRTHLWAPAAVSGASIIVSTPWGQSASASAVTIPSGDSNFTVSMNVSASNIKLWWPNGLGSQNLYPVTVSVVAPSAGKLQASRNVGFKYFVLVTGNDTDPNYVQQNKNVDGTDTQGMLFRVNGAAIYSRGANMIPLEEFEGRLNSTAIQRLVQSAVDANFNTLRIWGGGIFQPDVFYDSCDQMGILIYHDMQYAQDGHSPDQTDTQAAEFRHQARRISGHASLAMWDGCNECHVVVGTPTGIYATFVLTVVAEEDSSHVIWPSCPAAGWKAGVNRLTSMPNGSPLGLLPNAKPPAGPKDWVEAAFIDFRANGEVSSTRGPTIEVRSCESVIGW